MAFEISISLEEAELDYFREVMAKTKAGLSDHSEEKILESASSLFTDVKDELPHFIIDRLDKLEALVNMVRDEQWQLPEEDKANVLSSLAYFTEAEDLIADHIPALGFLDDAIMIELVAVELADNIEAYVEFCQYRDRKNVDEDVTVEDWLDAKRHELHSRMKHRRAKRSGRRSSFRSIF